MCGFAGFWNAGRRVDSSELETTALRMANTLRHRGPDSYGIWSYPQEGIAFGHRRLSIVDLSPAGDQPMRSRTGRFVLVYNGEIYNCEELRQHLFRECGDLHLWPVEELQQGREEPGRERRLVALDIYVDV